MGKKKGKGKPEGEKQENDGGKKDVNDGGKKDGGAKTVVLKIEMHCEGCATKIKKCLKSFGGETINRDEKDLNKITVTGKVDPVKIRDSLEQRMKRKVELISPVPKKDKDVAGDQKKKTTDDKPEKKPDEKKAKEPSLTTIVLKLNLHCEGCIQKIHKIVTKTKGYQEIKIDREKDTVTVKGSIEGKALAESLKEKLRRSVEIVPPKKEGGDKKENGGGGGGGGQKKEKGGGGGGGQDKDAVDGGEIGMGYVPYPYPNAYQYQYPPAYGPGLVVHAPQIFSDENPNACSIM